MAKALVEMAREGDIEGLLRTQSAARSSKADRDAYKWLCAAADFGHDEADEAIDDILEQSSLRYDDGRFETAAAHWELATAYLDGTDGLPRDLELARKHLEAAFEHHDLEAINAATGEQYSEDAVLERLPDAAQRVLRDGTARDELARAVRHVQRIRRLVDVAAPEVMIDDERRALRDVVATACPFPDQDQVARMGAAPLADELASLERSFAAISTALTLVRAEMARRSRS